MRKSSGAVAENEIKGRLPAALKGFSPLAAIWHYKLPNASCLICKRCCARSVFGSSDAMQKAVRVQ